MVGGELAHLPGAHEQDGAPRERGENLLGQLDGRERDGNGMTPDLRLRAYPLGDGERLAKQGVEGGPHRLRRLGQRERVLHLAKDLRLAQHHRVEAGGDPKDVPHGIAVDVGVEHRLNGGGIDTSEARELPEGCRAGRAGRFGHPVHLHPIAGGEDEQLGGDAQQNVAQLVLLHRERFAQVDGRRLVVEAGHKESHREPASLSIRGGRARRVRRPEEGKGSQVNPRTRCAGRARSATRKRTFVIRHGRPLWTYSLDSQPSRAVGL